jgi:hypothetical protein
MLVMYAGQIVESGPMRGGARGPAPPVHRACSRRCPILRTATGATIETRQVRRAFRASTHRRLPLRQRAARSRSSLLARHTRARRGTGPHHCRPLPRHLPPKGPRCHVPSSIPPDFVWGAATASYQIEGASHEDGRGESVWDRFCATPGKVAAATPATIACDFYHRYRDDIG